MNANGCGSIAIFLPISNKKETQLQLSLQLKELGGKVWMYDCNRLPITCKTFEYRTRCVPKEEREYGDGSKQRSEEKVT